jgi:hypothetical protein
MNGVLLGDHGYALSPFLLTPYSSVNSPEQQAFNRAHMKTRCTVERAFGQLKKRFACLHYGLGIKLNRVCLTILACFILHNFAKLYREEDIADIFKNDDEESNSGDTDEVNVACVSDRLLETRGLTLRREINLQLINYHLLDY